MVLNGTRNPNRKEVLKEIGQAIMIKPATKEGSARYYGKQEQAERLEKVYKKWSEHGGIWSAGAAKVCEITHTCKKISSHRI